MVKLRVLARPEWPSDLPLASVRFSFAIVVNVTVEYGMSRILSQSSIMSTFGRNVRRKLYEIAVSNASSSNNYRVACFTDELIGREIAITGLFEGDILKAAFDILLKQSKETFKTGCCLDVGANIGNHTCFFSSRFRDVLAFEPNPVAFGLLECNIKLSAWNAKAYNFGLSSREEKLRFAENRTNLGGSGFIDDKNINNGTFLERQLLVRRGDDVLQETHPEDKIVFIKVDVEGHELPALIGLEKTLLRFKPVVAVEMYSSRQDGHELMRFLKTLGYNKFESITKTYACKSALKQMLSRMSSKVYVMDLKDGYSGDHDFVVVS